MSVSDPADLSFATARELDHLVQTNPAAALHAARRWYAGAGDDEHHRKASALNALARSLFELGDVDRAVAAARQAVAAAEFAGDRQLSFSVAMSASAIFAEAGEIDEALGDLDVIAPGDTPAERGRLLVQRSYVLHHAGRLGEALAQLDRAEPEFTGAGDELGWLRLLVNRGLIRLQQGNLALAERDLLEADRVAVDLGQDAMRAGIASNLGVVYGRSRRIRDALEQFALALELHEAAGRPGRMVAVTELDRAETLMHAGLVIDAIAASEAAIVHVQPSGNVVVLGDSHLLLARCQMAAGRFRQARHSAAAAVVLFDRARRPEMAALARSVVAGAGLLVATDTQHEAFVESAALIHELQRNGWTQAADDLRLALVRCGRRIDDVDAVTPEVEYLRLGAFSEHRHLALAGWYAEAIARGHAGSADSALDACRAGLDLLDDIVAEATSLQDRSAAMRVGADLSQLAIDFAIENGEADTVLAAAEGTRARALHDEMAERHRHRPLTVEGAAQLRRELGARLAGNVLVEWVIAGDDVWAVVFAGGASRLVRLGPLRPILHARDRVVMWLDRAADEPDVSSSAAMRAAAMLDALLVAPLELPPDGGRRAGAGRWAARRFPWAGLPSLASRPLAMSANAQLWLEADRRAAGPARSVGLIEGPGVATGHVERAAIESVYPRVTLATGVGAAAATVRSMFGGLDLVHVAAHGTFRSDHPLLSTLRLHDGAATLYDTVPERMRSRLVILSSCEGGAHGAADGSEVLGLAAVMLARGAAAVLAPLTIVRELECADFVADVHRELSAGVAFGEAVASVRTRWLGDDDLSRWAVAGSFTCFGSTRVTVALTRSELAVAAFALGEPAGAFDRLARPDRRQAELGLVGHRLDQRQVPLLVARPAVGPQAALREAGDLVRQLDRRRQRTTGLGETIRKADPQRLVTLYAAPGQDQVEGVAVADQPRQPNRAAVDQWHAPSPAVHPERGVACGDTQVAHDRQLQTAGDAVALDGGDHRLAEHHPRRSHRAVVGHVGLDPVAALGGDRLEVGAGAERAGGTGEHGDRQRLVFLEQPERRRQPGCRRPVDGVAGVRPVDRDHAHRPVELDVHRFAAAGPLVARHPANVALTAWPQGRLALTM